MQLVLTTAGLNAINQASGPVTVVGFSLGTAYGYIPVVSDTDIHGSAVYSAVPSAPTLINQNTYRYSVVLDPTVGPFNFGEIGFYLPGNVLFALGAFPTLQHKDVVSNSSSGQDIRLDCYVTISGNNVSVFLDTLNSSDSSTIPRVASIDDLPRPADATNNLYNAIDSNDPNTMRLASSTDNVWTITGYERAGIMGTVVSATPTSVRVLLNQSYDVVIPNNAFIQFFSGPLMGVCRVVLNTAPAGTDTIFTINTQLSVLPIVGDQVQVHTKITTYTSEVPLATRDLLANLNSTLTASELNQLDGVDVANFVTKDGSRAFTGDQSLGGHIITNSGVPVNPNDLATKAYVDTLATGRAPKDNVRVASTGSNINLSAPGSTLDGVTFSSGDSFLAKDQTDAAQNGIYVWNGASTPATRRPDYDSPSEILPGTYFYASAGTVNTAKQFTLSTTGTIVVGTTPLTFITVDTSVLPADVIRSTGAVAFSADQSMGGNKVINLGTPTQNNDAVPKTYVDNGFLKRDGSNTPTADLNLAGLKYTNVGTALSSGDATNKQYVDLRSQGIALSTDVRVGSTANITLSSMPSAVDGVTLTSGDAFLAKNQTTNSQNGVYTFNGAGSPATRRADLTSSPQVVPGYAVKILQGTQANSVYVNTTALPVTLGTTSLTFTIYSSSMNFLADLKSDGSKAMTANFSLGGYRITDLGTPSLSTDAVTKGYSDSTFARLDGAATMTGSINAGGYVFRNEGTPSNDGDGANKLYVDVTSKGVFQKPDVKVASIANLNLSSPGANIDSIPMTAGDTFLAKNQTVPSQNGIYTYNGAASPATRRADFASAIQMIVGFGVKVLNGTHAGQVWVHSTTVPITVGTTSLSFTQFTAGYDITGYSRADGTVTMTGNQNAGGFKITNAADPTAAQDYATKAYVDATAGNPSGGLNAVNQRVINVATPTTTTDGANKQYADLRAQGIFMAADVKAASTANLNLTTMPASVDGVTLTSGDAFLAKNQSAGAQNGVYVFNGTGSAASRRTDFDTSVEAVVGYAVKVLGGSTNAGSVYVHSTTGSVVLGTTILSFTLYASTMDYTNYARVDGTTAFTANQSMGGNKLTNVGDPTSAQDASTKNYTDSAIGNIVAKDSVRAASTTNINLSAPGSTIDGVVMNSGESFLAKDQSTASQNGIYVFNGASSIATRRSDFSTSVNIKSGSLSYVREGTANAAKYYMLVTAGTITVGTTSLTFQALVTTGGGLGDIRSDGTVAFAANQSMGGNKLTNLGTPSTTNDATTKAYVDDADSAGSAKAPVRVASTGNLNLASMPSSVDGVTLNSGEAFLAKDQSTASQNGIYVFNGAAATATRRSDFSSTANIQPGSTVYVMQGSTNSSKYYQLQNSTTVTVGVTAIAFNLVSSATGNIRSDGAVAFGANQSMGGNALTNVGTTYAATDAANRQYVDFARVGISFLPSVRVASTGNLTIATPGSTIDGVTMSNGDSVLVKNQTTASQNGIYIWNGAASAMTRRSDFNTSGVAKRGIAVSVTAGTTQANTSWVHSTAISNLVLGTTNLTFTQYASGQDYSKLPRIFVDTAVSGGYSIDPSLYDEFQLTLTGNVVLSITNPLPGDHFIVKFRQDGIGGRTVTLPGTVRYNSSITSYTASSSANALDRIGLFYDGVDGKFDLLAMVKNIA